MSEVKEFDIKWTMVVDLDKCTGCGACMVACQAENNVAPNPDGTNKVRSINWMKVYRLSNHKPFPEHDTAYLPRPCMQCGKPSCVSVCPVVATDKNEDGGIVRKRAELMTALENMRRSAIMPTLQRFLTHHPCEHILRNASDNADFTSATRHRPDEALDFVLCPGKKIPRLIIGQDQLPGLSLPLNAAAD